MAGHRKKKAADAASAESGPARAKTRREPKPDYPRRNEYKQLRAALLASQADADGVVPELAADKISEYMDLWVLRQQLRDDVRKRGVTVWDDRGRASENRSISLGIQTGKQMAALRKDLGLVPAGGATASEENEEDFEL